ncbi:ATPase [Pseudomonas petrae]|uniref:ATPase n=1 Tax=Pseudomonas petrae TaxID=2912190 RepID=A0ABS9I2K3_9PSED|nr:ATPase [Pseudomonas petrae]MCF7531222.1 ATPase [Pseudomonas petrae]MCF7540060.1 ATPase [Pseudomonas petrae]MCF7542025.1 ATPase [Pseudomonas petrae]MCF7554592.1 ATPase [Pseudomonas petrae]
MKTNRSITRAFCVELQQELSIVTARREYFSQEPPRARFSFLCSSEPCRALGVKITGVRYDVKPQEHPTFVAAHYRANPNYEHHADCEWVDDAVETPVGQDAETEAETELRKVKRKLDDYIDVFDPTPRERATPTASTDKPDAERPEKTADATPPTDALKVRQDKQNRTSNLERLVDSFRQAQASLSKEELALLTLRIPGQGEVSLRAYFRHIKFAQLNDERRVLYGGGLVERYGTGFKFKFFDRLQSKLVTLYVSPAQMQAYRSSRYLSELLSHADEVRFFTVFALGTLVASPSGKSVSVEIEDLRHLAIVLGPAKDAEEAPAKEPDS